MSSAWADAARDRYSQEETLGGIFKKEGKLLKLRPPPEISSFALKTFACLIDQGLLFIPTFITSIFVGSLFLSAYSNSKIDINFIKAVSLGIFISSHFLIHWLYFSLSESSSKGATLGMSVLGLKVIKKHGERLTFLEANNRYWSWLLISLFFGVNLLGLLGHDKKLLHDRLCDTSVIVDS